MKTDPMGFEMQSGHPRIREATIEDVDRLVLLVRDCVSGMRAAGIEQWDEHYPDRRTIEADVDSRSAFVAARGDAIAGMVVLNDHQDPEYVDVVWKCRGRPAVVHRLMVAPEWQGRGVARALLRFAESRAAELCYDCVRLDVFCGNPRARRFYERAGYRRAGTVAFRAGLFDCLEKSLRFVG